MRTRLQILNLYAGIGGNRNLWGNRHHITAVERDREIAQVYQEQFPHDTVLVEDAHAFLLNHFNEFDFIWTSPPCITHTRLNMASVKVGRDWRYADMSLYQEIILLRESSYKSKAWLVENVIPYYQPVVPPTQRLGRHMVWSNLRFNVSLPHEPEEKMRNSASKIENYLNIHLVRPKLIAQEKWRQMMRNCFHPVVGKQILERVERYLGV